MNSATQIVFELHNGGYAMAYPRV